MNGNHILMANFSKHRKYQTFGLIELHNLSKGQLADRIFKLWKSCVYDYQVVEHTFFEILILDNETTSRFQNRFWKYW